MLELLLHWNCFHWSTLNFEILIRFFKRSSILELLLLWNCFHQNTFNFRVFSNSELWNCSHHYTFNFRVLSNSEPWNYSHQNMLNFGVFLNFEPWNCSYQNTLNFRVFSNFKLQTIWGFDQIFDFLRGHPSEHETHLNLKFFQTLYLKIALTEHT